MMLRNHIIDLFEHADMQSDPELRRALLTFVVAGGGFAGAETVAELNDFAYTARRYYPNVRPAEVRVVLVHHGSHIMPELSQDLGDYALAKLRKRGVEVFLNTGVLSATAESVELTNQETIRTHTLVWTAGIAPSPLLATLPCARNKRGQIVVNEYLEVPDRPRLSGLWAIVPRFPTHKRASPTRLRRNMPQEKGEYLLRTLRLLYAAARRDPSFTGP